jgi:hypothetical protein
MVILRVLENAFTEVNIKPEEWKALQAGVAQSAQAQGGPPGGGGGGSPDQQAPGDLQQAAMSLPPDVKAKAMQMKAQGATSQEIAKFLQDAVQQQHGVTGAGENSPMAQAPPPTVQ